MAQFSAGSAGKVRSEEVFTYNILSPKLCSAPHFPQCRPDDLTESVRLKRVLAKLEDPIRRQAVIALQEVSLLWSGPLHALFAQNGYNFHCSLYGKEYNDYMGVALAWPQALYIAEDVVACRLSDSKSTPWPVKASVSKEGEPTCCSFAGIKRLFGSEEPHAKLEFDPWAEACRRDNRMVMCTLRPRDNRPTFCIATYHMPCLFGSVPKLQVVNVHTSLAVKQLSGFANGRPSILLGDFNFNKDASSYQLLTSAYLPKDHPEILKPAEGDTWTVSPLPMRLRSAYSIFNGKEPEFTNHAVTALPDGGLNKFTDVLDFVFVSDHWKVERCLPLPPLSDFGGPLPDEREPSDHIAIGASLTTEMRMAKHVSVPTKPKASR